MSVQKTDVGNSPDPVGSIDLTITGGTESYDVVWTYPDGTTSTDEDIENLQKGNYRVVVSDKNNCLRDTIISIHGYGIECPASVSLCPHIDIPDADTTIEQFILHGGLISSTTPIDSSSFSVVDISDGNSCPETIIRTYSVMNENGDLISCDQLILREDTEKPILKLPERRG